MYNCMIIATTKLEMTTFKSSKKFSRFDSSGYFTPYLIKCSVFDLFKEIIVLKTSMITIERTASKSDTFSYSFITIL